MSRAKRKYAFELAQNEQIQIILYIYKCSSGPLLSSRTFCYIYLSCYNRRPSIYPVSGQWRPWPECADTQDDLGLSVRICPKTRLRMALPILHLDLFWYGTSHYENTPIRILRKFHLQKLKIFGKKTTTKKNSDIFHISAQNIDCVYLLESPRRGGSNEYSQSMFWADIRKIMYTPVNPIFTI